MTAWIRSCVDHFHHAFPLQKNCRRGRGCNGETPCLFGKGFYSPSLYRGQAWLSFPLHLSPTLVPAGFSGDLIGERDGTENVASLRITCAATLLVLVLCVPCVMGQDTEAERELSRPMLGTSIARSSRQVTDAERELSRLQAQAEDAMDRGDPQDAAIRIGRAALFASRLSKQRVPRTDQPPYRLMVDLFRTQEQVYRALALFQQSGEQTPVSSGICTLLALGKHHATQALKNSSANATGIDATLQEQTTEWLETVQELQREWECGN